jgi:hypothetical protein
MAGRPAGRVLLVCGWLVTAVLAGLSLAYLAIHLA